MGTTTLGHLTEGARSSMKKGITIQKLGTATLKLGTTTLGDLPKIPRGWVLQPKWVTRPEK
jgi:hypothetical protein